MGEIGSKNREVRTTEILPKIVAFYLPQFHTIPENDEWWGAGFTEWTNLKKAQPLFQGHRQPREPSTLGYYDLTDESVLEHQTELAKEHGIGAFCFHYYYFGKDEQLLEMPLDRMLDSGKPDFPFCLCWANENWTRTWDGSDDKILMLQRYGSKDIEGFALSVIPCFRDHRYLRIEGKPLLVIYNTRSIPDTVTTIERLRAIWKSEAGMEVHVCAALTFGEENPMDLGVDSAVEFPPHNVRDIHVGPEAVGLDSNFQGSVLDYSAQVFQAISAQAREYTCFPGIMPDWDNTPRRGENGTFFVNGNPIVYQNWLLNALENTTKNNPESRRLVFVNAWNEWAEGAHLEPDQQRGSIYLEATKLAAEGEKLLPYLHKKAMDGTTLSKPETEVLREAEAMCAVSGDKSEAGGGTWHLQFMRMYSDMSAKVDALETKVAETKEKRNRERSKKLENHSKLEAERERRARVENTLIVKGLKPLINLEKGIRKMFWKRAQDKNRPTEPSAPAKGNKPRPATDSSPFVSDTNVRFGNTSIRLAVDEDLYLLESTPESFVLGKSREMVERLFGWLDDVSPKNIVDIGVYKGGSIVLLNEYCTPDKLIGIERNPVRGEALDEYLKIADHSERIKVCHDVDQSDLITLKKICAVEFGDQEIDIVIDDASHFCHETRESFRFFFPRLRHGGLYIIEDWGWAHWPEDYWQKEKGGEYFEKKDPVTNLILELVILSASASDLIEDIWMDRGQLKIRRGPRKIESPFCIEDLTLNRGVDIPFIPGFSDSKTEITRTVNETLDEKPVIQQTIDTPVEPTYDYNADCLKVWGKSVDFLQNKKFLDAYQTGIDGDDKLEDDPHIEWRAHVCTWAAQHALNLDGDFVECGVWTGRLSLAVCEYIDFNSTGKNFFLFDTFCGVPDEQLTDEERAQWREQYNEGFWDCYETAVRNFKPYPKAVLIQGKVPDTLETPDIDKVCYLSLDMNILAPEIAAIRFFWDKLSSGAPVILDDYGWTAFLPQKKAMDEFAKEKGVEILNLPTGQGILIRP